jgi:gas vesicle protein
MLRGTPGLRPIAVLREVYNRYPEIGQDIRRTIQRRVRRWQDENDPDPSRVLRQRRSMDQRVSEFLRSAHQGILGISDLPTDAQAHESIHEILTSCRSGTFAHRNKALLALAVVCGLPVGYVAKYPVASCASLYRWKDTFLKGGYHGLMKPNSRENAPQRGGRCSCELIDKIWDSEILPMLRATPELRPVAVLRQIYNRYPEIGQRVRRTIERRVRRWQDENDPDPSRVLRQRPSMDQWVSEFLRSAHQGILGISDLPTDAQAHESIHEILTSCRSGTLAHRNKALLALAVVCGLRLGYVSKYPIASCASLYRWRDTFLKEGYHGLMKPISRENQRFQDKMVTSVVFKTLHEPPELHGFHRTNWRQIDLHAALKNIGTHISIWTLRRVIRARSYQWRKAKIVLTSNDPEYRSKIDKIKQILGSLADDECFFSIDEYGPFNIRLMPGKKLCAPDEFPTVPQWQKRRSKLILTGALELRTNQITHFYSEAKTLLK